MSLTISIPERSSIIKDGVGVHTAPVGVPWSKAQLGAFAGKSGVYLLHSNGVILYVGKTTVGDYGNFGERLRRHFHEKASHNSRVHRFLRTQCHPIRASFLDLETLDTLIGGGTMDLSRERKALVMEQVLIGLFSPGGNAI